MSQLNPLNMYRDQDFNGSVSQLQLGGTNLTSNGAGIWILYDTNLNQISQGALYNVTANSWGFIIPHTAFSGQVTSRTTFSYGYLEVVYTDNVTGIQGALGTQVIFQLPPAVVTA